MTLQILVWDGYHKETTISSLITEATAYTECRTSIKIPVFQVLIFSPVFIYIFIYLFILFFIFPALGTLEISFTDII